MPRGTAAVEMAVTMVLLVPLILYTLFLQDLLNYKLENQEPTIVAGWDHITTDYMTSTADVGGMNRLKYCDHSAAYDSYTDKDYDCESATHHQAPTAHQCWITAGGEQVQCTVIRDEGDSTDRPSGSFHGWVYGKFHSWSKGGMAVCSARLAVMNYFLPNTFMNWFSRVDVTDKERFEQDAHADKDATTVDNTWVLVKEYFAVMADPWALNHIGEVEPGDFDAMTGGGAGSRVPGKVQGEDYYHPLLDRTGHFYKYYGNRRGLADAESWRTSVSGLLSEYAQIDTIGDHLGSVPVSWKPEKTRSESAGYASGWADQRMSRSNRPNRFPAGWGP